MSNEDTRPQILRPKSWSRSTPREREEVFRMLDEILACAGVMRNVEGYITRVYKVPKTKEP